MAGGSRAGAACAKHDLLDLCLAAVDGDRAGARASRKAIIRSRAAELGIDFQESAVQREGRGDALAAAAHAEDARAAAGGRTPHRAAVDVHRGRLGPVDADEVAPSAGVAANLYVCAFVDVDRPLKDQKALLASRLVDLRLRAVARRAVGGVIEEDIFPGPRRRGRRRYADCGRDKRGPPDADATKRGPPDFQQLERHTMLLRLQTTVPRKPISPEYVL